MGYSAKAASIRIEAGKIADISVSINGIAFDTVWSGKCYNKFINDLSQIIKTINNIESNLNNFASGLDKLQKYKDTVTEISSLRSRIDSLSNKIKNNNSSYSNISLLSSMKAQLEQLIQDNESLKKEIKGIMSSFGSGGSNFGIAGYGTLINYTINIDELLKLYSSGQLIKLADGKSLYDLYDEYDESGTVIIKSGKEYIESLIVDIQQKYSGREAAVNSSLLMFALAADKGVKLDYQHKGTTWVPYVPTQEVASGVDCNPYASWVIDKGVDGGFSWRPVQSFPYVGEKIEYENWSQAQPGDVFANGDHVGIIIENDPENGKFIVAHASGDGVGIVLQEKSYDTLFKDNYKIQDMTAIYDGTDTSPVEYTQKIFTRLVNEQRGGWENYQRDV